MKVFKLTLIVVDHDGQGFDMVDIIENQKYPNYCISPTVVEIKSAEIGKWNDDHPLNSREKFRDEVQRLFPEVVFTEPVADKE